MKRQINGKSHARLKGVQADFFRKIWSWGWACHTLFSRNSTPQCRFNYLTEIFAYIHQKRCIRKVITAFDMVDHLFLEPFSSINLYDLTPLCFLLSHCSFSISLAGFSLSSYSLNIRIPYLAGPSIFICLPGWSHPVPWLYHSQAPNSTLYASLTLSK